MVTLRCWGAAVEVLWVHRWLAGVVLICGHGLDVDAEVGCQNSELYFGCGVVGRRSRLLLMYS